MSAELGDLAQALAQHLPELVAQASKEENAYTLIPDPSSALHGIQPPSSSSHTPTTSSCPSSDNSFPWGQASPSAHDAQVQQYPDIMHEQFKPLLQVLKSVTSSKLGVRPNQRLKLSLCHGCTAATGNATCWPREKLGTNEDVLELPAQRMLPNTVRSVDHFEIMLVFGMCA